jgi:GT2 family glycosyltransferase
VAGLAVILGIPVLNRPELLRACVASIDEDVHLVVIDNSPEGDWAGDIALTYPGQVTVAQPPANLGYTASVNHIIRAFPREPAWYVANADTVFAPGDLSQLASVTELAPGDGGRWVGIIDWRVFGLTAEAVERVGLWDENFFNYCSDADYEYRCRLAGVEMVRLTGETGHVGSVCYQGDPRYAPQNARSYPVERAYYRSKWGGDLRGGEVHVSPFNQGGHVGDWRLDLSVLRQTAWT